MRAARLLVPLLLLPLASSTTSAGDWCREMEDGARRCRGATDAGGPTASSAP